MNITLSQLVLFIVFGAACEAADTPSKVSPITFVASLQGFAGASYKVEMTASGDVTYLANPHTFTSAPGTTRTKIRVEADRWALFRRRLDAAKVWSWRSDYVNSTVADGTVW